MRPRPRPETVRPTTRPRPNDLASRPHGPRGLNIPVSYSKSQRAGVLLAVSARVSDGVCVASEYCTAAAYVASRGPSADTAAAAWI